MADEQTKSGSGSWLVDTAARAARFAGEVVAETLWPTRCALCDTPGEVLCERCERAMPYIDWWRACRRCGAPYGYAQCTACNEVTLAQIGRMDLPYAGCASAAEFEGGAGRVVRVFKDQGEQRLSSVMAAAMARALPPSWAFDFVTFVPATLAAYRYRGFDHAQLLADSLAAELGAPCSCVFDRPKTRDQRSLGASQRVRNLSKRFAASESVSGKTLLLVDDVYTTGATLCAATDALAAVGVEAVYCITYARV